MTKTYELVENRGARRYELFLLTPEGGSTGSYITYFNTTCIKEAEMLARRYLKPPQRRTFTVE